ncbi:hypothetical protein SNOG_14713 [Parastagonospora nodorum SN15]|uniref:Uncharacterized protein n=1 Tax=Phaeosphaeria nodorum (strain SN15 / ATCC MYA-4574 / FGSC 10173) TaxID=321614 RepID=Q0U0K1_PHANO|nr:hypothetical protein SNOG_14713 [Parastagonospora nodorum SN15]EAT77905.1 hypothetical protein SNOG_14713 [Parastagonospora nodorum SN15]
MLGMPTNRKRTRPTSPKVVRRSPVRHAPIETPHLGEKYAAFGPHDECVWGIPDYGRLTPSSRTVGPEDHCPPVEALERATKQQNTIGYDRTADQTSQRAHRRKQRASCSASRRSSIGEWLCSFAWRQW